MDDVSSALHYFPLNGRVFHPPELYSPKQFFQGCAKIAQLYRCTQFPRPYPKYVPFPPAPGSPLNNHDVLENKESLGEVPLELLNASTLLFTVQVDPQTFHPVIGGSLTAA